MSDQLALPPIADHRSNEEIARKLWRDVRFELARNEGLSRALVGVGRVEYEKLDKAVLAVIMAALADVRGVGTA